MLPISLAIIMLGMGASLVVADFKRVFVYPKAVAIGIVGQILLLPLVGFLFASQFGLTPEFSVGLMMLVACAGGATSNMIVYLAKGDVALSVTLTAISSCITVISIPFVINFVLYEFMGATEEAVLPIGSTNMKLFAITMLPVMLVRHYYPGFSQRLEKPINKLATVFFVLIVVGVLVKERAAVVDVLAMAGPVTCGLNFVTMLLGFITARLLQLNEQQSITVSVEIGVQNSAAEIFIAATLLQNSEIVPTVYSLIMYLNAGLLIGMMHWYMKRSRVGMASTN